MWENGMPSQSDVVRAIRKCVLKEQVIFAIRRGKSVSEIHAFLTEIGCLWGIENVELNEGEYGHG